MSSPQDIITLGLLFMSLYFEIFMLITYMESRKSLHTRVATGVEQHEDLPAVTIVVPCYNEQYTAVKTINSLLALEYPADKLLIKAIDDGSTDGTRMALEVFRNHPQIEIIHKENGGKHTVLNLAISRVTTDFIGCLDADSYVAPDALLRLMRRFNEPNIMAVVPSLHIHKAQTWIQRLQKTEYLIGVFLRSMQGELNAIYVTPGPFSIFKVEVFKKIGPYKKAYNTEDMELAMRMQANGMKIVNAHDAVVYTSSPPTVPKLYRQRVRWTSGFLQNVIYDYRFMLFRSRYGTVGSFILPLMVFSTFCVLAIVGLFLYDLYIAGHAYVTSFRALGLHMFEWSWPHFGWFYTATTPLLFLTLFTTASVIYVIVTGSRLSHGNKAGIVDVICYFFLYGLIMPFWVLRSLANVVLSKQAVWR